MATLHPTQYPDGQLHGGQYRERDMLAILEQGLPAGYDVFHSIYWSEIREGEQSFGELDIVVVSPMGNLALLEIKAGNVSVNNDGITKLYASLGGQPKDVGRQARRQHSAMLSKLDSVGLGVVQVAHLLILPDQVVAQGTVGYPRQRIVDAGQIDQLCTFVRDAISDRPVSNEQRKQLIDFLSDRFKVQPDPSIHIGQVNRISRVLSEGLATWVPRIHQNAGIYVIEATAGSGKTQLAVTLLRRASQDRRKAAYLCYNRPLADHMLQAAPHSVEISTFHEYCVSFSRSRGVEPDFSSATVFGQAESHLIANSDGQVPSLDVLVIDESQDFEPQWVMALLPRLKSDSSLYILRDGNQQVYGREDFDLPDAVTVSCMDNFRSPRAVVQTINTLRLTSDPVVARSAFAGQTPGILTYAAGQVNVVTAVEKCIEGLISEGFTPEQIAVVTFAGRDRSEVMRKQSLAGRSVKAYQGNFDKAGNACWSEGEILVETLYRFKGQSAPVVVLCEVDFEAIDEKVLNKLFVGFTRAQYRLECILSQRAGVLLMNRIDETRSPK